MNAIVQLINAAGRAFIDFALPMLIQSSVLILILLAVDLGLRWRVRAVFRYWIWALVLVKLVLPPSLDSPVSLGTWLGDELTVSTTALFEPQEPTPAASQAPEPPPAAAHVLAPPVPASGLPSAPAASDVRQPPIAPADAHYEEPAVEATPPSPEVHEALPPAMSSAPALTWQGLVVLLWGAVVTALLLLLIQRAFFVRGLVGQSREADSNLSAALEECRARLRLRGPVAMRLSPNASTPAVCGLLRPVILVPQNLAPRLQRQELRAVLLHELAHVKRGDLWVNLAQTLLQIIYFYSPLLWLANAMLRRTREQAVDETVLVAMGETARQYPEILVNIAKLAFRRRPVLSLRLIGVVESRNALTARIRHILSRPLPKTAGLGLLGLMVVAGLAAVLLPMAQAAQENFAVENKGPLDIQFLGVCPDGGEELYDANGKKLDVTFPPLGTGDGPWKADELRRDFVLRVPEFDGQLLFLPFSRVCPSGTNIGLGAGYGLFDAVDGPATLAVSSTLRRTYHKAWARLIVRKLPVRKVDLTLQYFHGPRREAICIFTGPFTPGKTMQADEGRPYQLTPAAPRGTAPESHLYLEFHFTTSQPFTMDVPVLLYDRQGWRHLVQSGGGSRGSSGASLTYQTQRPVVSWEEVAAITIGERAHESTFRNIVVDYPRRPVRTYPAYWDQMAERLGLTGLSPEELARYEFKNAQEAIAVLDFIRGPYQIEKAVRAIGWDQPRVDFAALDTATRDKLRRVAARWLESPVVSVRAEGVQLGLIAGFREFLEPAFALLNYQHPIDAHQRREVCNRVLYSMGRYMDEVTAADIDRLIRLALDRNDGWLWSRVFEYCLRTSRRALVSDVLWELAQDDRPWLWWPAIMALQQRNDQRVGRTSSGLPEPMQSRVLMVSDMSRPGEATLTARGKALLPELLTLETVRMYPGAAWGYQRVIARYLDRSEATAVYMRFLRELSQPGVPERFEREHGWHHSLYSVVAALVRNINLWYEVNLGQLGVHEPGKLGEDISSLQALRQIVAETLSWYEANEDQQPREAVFAGRVVDTSGGGIAGAALTLSRQMTFTDELGRQGQRQVAVGTVRTDADGRFVFRDLPNAEHDWLNVTAAGFVARERLSVSRLPDGRYWLPYDRVTDNVITMEKPASLAGRVIGPDGRPLAKVMVHLQSYLTHANPGGDSPVTDGEGRFHTGPTMSGYHLAVVGARGRDAGPSDYDGGTAFQLVRVEEGQTVENVVLDLRESTACLVLEIVDANDEPVQAMRVSLEIDLPQEQRSQATILYYHDLPPQRVHRVENLPQLDGHLEVWANERHRQRAPVKLVRNQTTRCRVKFDQSAAELRPFAPPNRPRRERFEVTLPNGVTVQLLGLRDARAADNAWWAPDGSPLPEPVHSRNLGAYGPPGDAFRLEDTVEREIAYRLTGAADPNLSPAFELDLPGIPPGQSPVTNYRHSLVERTADAAVRSEHVVLPRQFDKAQIRILFEVPDDEGVWKGRARHTGASFMDIALQPGVKTHVTVGYLTPAPTRRLEPSELDEVQRHVSVVAAPLLQDGHYLLPKDGRVTLRDVIYAARYRPDHKNEALLEVIRQVDLGGTEARLIYSRNLWWLFQGGESDVPLEPGDAIVGGYVESARDEKAPPPYQFGDVITLALTSEDKQRATFIDLDTGRLHTPPANLDTRDSEALRAWMAAHSVDARFDSAPAVRGLVGLNMLALKVGDESWYDTPADLRDRLLMKADAPVLLRGDTRPPATYLIKTDEYRMGILQILAPDGTSIQYKLLENQGSGAGSPPPDRDAGGGVPAEPNAAGNTLELHVALTHADLEPGIVAHYQQLLAAGERRADRNYAWGEVEPGTELPRAVVKYEHDGKTYMLLCNGPRGVMSASQGWRVQGQTTAYRPANDKHCAALRLIFDRRGAEILRDLTEPHVGRPLAFVLDGRVALMGEIAAPLREGVCTFVAALPRERVEQIDVALRRNIAALAAQLDPMNPRNTAPDPVFGLVEAHDADLAKAIDEAARRPGRVYGIAAPALSQETAGTPTYSPVPSDRGAGGGALVGSGETTSEPANAGPIPGKAAARLANGVTVRFMAYSQLTAEGLTWWNSRGEATTVPGVYEADVDGLGTVLAFDVHPPESEVSDVQMYRGPEKERVNHIWRVPNSNIRLVALGEQRSFANVEITTRLVEAPAVELIPLTAEDRGEVVEVGKFGIDKIVDLQAIESSALLAEADEMMGLPPGMPVDEETLWSMGMGEPPVIQFTSIKSPGSYPSLVAVQDKEGLTHRLIKLTDNPRAATYTTCAWPDQLAAVVVEGSPMRESNVRFRNIALTPGHTTTIQVETDPQPQLIWQYSRVSLLLGTLVGGLEQYRKDHGDRLPGSLVGMRGYLHDESFHWLTEHVAYIGEGGPPPQDGSSIPVAYDQTLLPQSRGTYVVYAHTDGQHVEFESPKELKELGIPPDGAYMEGARPAESGFGGGTLARSGETTNGSAEGGEKKTFSVYGTVTDRSGRPMVDVEVTAHCGMGTLMPTGRAVTDEAGRYTLYFGPGLRSTQGAYPDNVPVQAATIHARKAGFYEANLCRQGHLGMAGWMPSGEDRQRIARYAGVVLPSQPHELDFVMRPAARIEGELVDARGKPLPGRTLVLTGDKLYPSTNALASVETDQDGAFVVERVPLESFWFEYGRPTPAKTASIHFTTPGTWRIRLQCDESQGTAKLTIASQQPPAPASGLLEFRIAPKPGELAAGVEERYAQMLAENRPAVGEDLAWFEVRPGVQLPPDVVSRQHEGRTWLLLWNEPSHAMLAGQDWGLKDVYETTDAMDRQSVGLTLDEKGAQLFHELTQANVRNSLAIILDGKVLSTPTIMSPIAAGQCLVVGNFTAEEVRQIITVLKEGMTKPRAASSLQAALFRVHGVVTDASGRPMAGVEVYVDCGFEKPRRADRALTDANGRYALEFKPAMYVADADPYGVGIQPAFIRARKDGFYETSLQHKGNLALAGKRPGPEEQRFVAGRAGVVLPHESYELNFTMAPAARLEGTLVDAQDKPLAACMIGLLSRRMYPPNVGFATVRTDSGGTFTIENVPCTSFQFSCFNTPLGQSGETAFPRPGTWRLNLKYRQTGQHTAELAVMDLQEPTTTTGPGPLGRHALSFDGVDDCLVVPPSPSMTLKPPFFIEVWAKPDFSALEPVYATDSDAGRKFWPYLSLVRKGNPLEPDEGVLDGGFQTFIRPASDPQRKCAGSLYAVSENGRLEQVDLFDSGRLDVGRAGWYHIATDFQRERYRPSPDGPLVIGGNILTTPQGFAFKGEIAEIRIWNKALTEAEVQWYRSSRLKGTEPNLVACWTFEEGAGQIVRDISRNGNHAQLGTTPEADAADPRWVSVDAEDTVSTVGGAGSVPPPDDVFIPPDANDAWALAPGVVLDGIGQDVEGKAFISCVRDIEQTRNARYRFVLTAKDGRTLEPQYYTSLERAGGRLWEKFSFDRPYHRQEIECFRFEVRPGGDGSGPEVPSAWDEIHAVATERPAHAQEAPPGRYAIHFDGKDDYLFVPDAPSLWVKAPFFVEAWIQPEIEPTQNEPDQAFLAKGGYTRTGKVDVRGFGLRLARHKSDPTLLIVDQALGRDQGVTAAATGHEFTPGWMHVTGEFTFGDANDISAPGHPLVVGAFLIPTEKPFKGRLAELRIWDSSADRPSKAVPLAGTEPGLVACWTFEEGAGQIAHDLSPNANHARLGASGQTDAADPAWVDLPAAQDMPAEVSARVPDASGSPAAGAQVGPGTEDKGVVVHIPRFMPASLSGAAGESAIGADGFLRAYEANGFEFEAGFVPDKTEYVWGEPMHYFTYVVRNTGDKPLAFVEGGDYRGGRSESHQITAVDAYGRPVRMPEMPGMGGIIGVRELQPGEVYAKSMPVDRRLTFSGPGVYQVTGRRTLRFGATLQEAMRRVPPQPGAMPEEARSLDVPTENSLRLTIHPYSPERMTRLAIDVAGEIAGYGDLAPKAVEFTEPEGLTQANRLYLALETLVSIQEAEALDQLIRLARQGPENLRIAAVQYLGRRTEPRAMTAIMNALNDPQAVLRAAAVQALGTLCTEEAVDVLLSRFGRGEPEMAAPLLRAMGRTRSSRVMDLLSRSLAADDATMRDAAVEGFVAFGSEQAIEILKTCVGDPDMDFRERVVRHLAESLRQSIDARWLVPVVQARKGADSIGDAPRLMRLYAGERAVPALLSCLDFGNPSIRSYYNHAIIGQQGACQGGLRIPWISDLNRDGSAEELEHNTWVLRAIRTWVDHYYAYRLDEETLSQAQYWPEQDKHWGEPVDGIGIRIRCDQRVWPEGMPQVIKIDVREAENEGSLNLTRPPDVLQVELNGRLYEHRPPLTEPATGIEGYGTSFHNLVLDDGWRCLTDDQPLRLTPGRYALTVRLSTVPAAQRTGLAASRPVRFEVIAVE